MHLQNTTADQMSDVSRLRNGLNIRRPNSKANIMNESSVKSCLGKFDDGSYSRLQFLRAVSHCMDAHTAALQPADSDSDDDDDGDDRQSTAATTSTAPHTAAAAAYADTMCEVCFVAPWHRARGSRWYPAAMRAFASPAQTALLLWTHAQCAVATSPWWCEYSCRHRRLDTDHRQHRELRTSEWVTFHKMDSNWFWTVCDINNKVAVHSICAVQRTLRLHCLTFDARGLR